MSKECKVVRFTDNDDRAIQFPVCTITGDGPGPTVCVTAGMHGCEYPGIAAAIRFVKTIDCTRVRGTIRVITISNVPSFEDRNMYQIPYDQKDQYDFFPGALDGTYSDVLVYHLVESFIKGSDYYIDLHGGDLIEDLLPLCLVHRSGDPHLDRACLQLAQHYRLPRVVITEHKGKRSDKGKIYSGAAELGIPSVLAEVGRIGQLEESATRMHFDGLCNVLCHVGSLEGSTQAEANIECYEDWFEVRCTKQGVFYNRISIGDRIAEGQTVGVVEDYFGNEVETVISPAAGTVLVTVTSPAVKAGSLLLIVGSDNPKSVSVMLANTK